MLFGNYVLYSEHNDITKHNICYLMDHKNDSNKKSNIYSWHLSHYILKLLANFNIFQTIWIIFEVTNHKESFNSRFFCV